MAVARANYAMGTDCTVLPGLQYGYFDFSGSEKSEGIRQCHHRPVETLFPALIFILIRQVMITVNGINCPLCFRPNLPLKMILNIRMI